MREQFGSPYNVLIFLFSLSSFITGAYTPQVIPVVRLATSLSRMNALQCAVFSLTPGHTSPGHLPPRHLPPGTNTCVLAELLQLPATSSYSRATDISVMLCN